MDSLLIEKFPSSLPLKFKRKIDEFSLQARDLIDEIVEETRLSTNLIQRSKISLPHFSSFEKDILDSRSEIYTISDISWDDNLYLMGGARGKLLIANIEQRRIIKRSIKSIIFIKKKAGQLGQHILSAFESYFNDFIIASPLNLYILDKDLETIKKNLQTDQDFNESRKNF